VIPLLMTGDTVGIVAPSSPVAAARLGPGIAWLESLGYSVRLGASVGASDRFLAGSDDLRAKDFVDMFADDEIRAVFAGRGGYGSSRILNLIDWETVGAHPKPFVGFSDTTALQLALLQRTGMASLTGLALASDIKESGPNAGIERDLLVALGEGRFAPVDGLAFTGSIEGNLLGGCLSLVTHLVGTSYLPDLSGCLLLLEDVGESPYRIDRLLTQLVLSDVLETAAGVIFGTFHECKGDAEDGTIDQVLADFSERCPCPVILGMPYGHGTERRVLPVGGSVHVSGGTLTFGELI
jgi:muramoyltetrapeptide carboxypeptidase